MDATATATATTSTDACEITSRWEPVLVTRIENVRIVNMARFEDSKPVNLGGPFNGRVSRDQAGMLSHADAEIVVSLPESVNFGLLSLHLDNSVTLSSRETRVVIGRSVSADDSSSSSSSSSSFDSLECGSSGNTFRFLVPLTRGLYDRVPLLDELHTKKKHFVHHTVSVAGIENGRHTEWLVRIRVDPEEATVDVVSVNNSFIDTVRLGESWNNLCQAMNCAATKLADSAKACWAARKAAKYAPLPTSEPTMYTVQAAPMPLMPASFGASPANATAAGALYPPIPQQGMMCIPVFQPSGAAPAGVDTMQPKLVYYAMPSNGTWPPTATTTTMPAPIPVHIDAAHEKPEKPKFEIISSDDAAMN